MHVAKLTVAYLTTQQQPQAEQLATQLGLEVSNQSQAALLVTPDKLMLKYGAFAPMAADFMWSTWCKRRYCGKKPALVRAIKPNSTMYIIDATAGWGRDAAILASFGAHVLMLEREPFMGAILANALENRDEISKQRLNLELQVVDAMHYLESLSASKLPDVIYLDPMHPLRKKSALVKKELQVLQNIIGADPRVLKLLNLAMSKSKRFVVLKWPRHGPKLLSPRATIIGQTIRYDIY